LPENVEFYDTINLDKQCVWVVIKKKYYDRIQEVNDNVQWQTFLKLKVILSDIYLLSLPLLRRACRCLGGMGYGQKLKEPTASGNR
jgi:hypothetical protein